MLNIDSVKVKYSNAKFANFIKQKETFMNLLKLQNKKEFRSDS